MLVSRGSPFRDWSSDDPGEPIEVVDSFDFNDGPAKVLGLPEVEGVMRLALDVKEESVLEFDAIDLPLPFAEETVEGGERALRNCFGFLRNVRAGLRPLFCLTEGLAEGDASSDAVISDAIDIPDTLRCEELFFAGVDALRNTARR